MSWVERTTADSTEEYPTIRNAARTRSDPNWLVDRVMEDPFLKFPGIEPSNL